MKKKIEKSSLSDRLAKATKVILGVIIGGVLASTSIAVGARSIDYISLIDDIIYDVEPTIRITSPASGDYIGATAPVRIIATAYKGISRVELYVRHDLSPELVGTVYGYGPGFTMTFDASKYTDHGFATVYAVAYTRAGQIVTSDFVHLRIEKCATGAYCAKVYSGAAGDQRMRQTISGLVAGKLYTVEYSVKQATSNAMRVRVLSTDETKTYANCDMTLSDYSWSPANECTFIAQSTDALLVINGGDDAAAYSTDSFSYIDDISIHQLQSQENVVANSSFTTVDSLWKGTAFTRLQITPTTLVKPFAPSTIYSVTSNLPIVEDQNVGFWFFKGWPQSHYTWWTKLGYYERPSLYQNPTGAYAYQQGGTDSMKWFSPLVMWLSRESFDTEHFSYSDIKLTVTSDKGTLDICVPDVDWQSPIINGFGIKGLAVDQYGNTYYAGKYDDPDLLQASNIAKRCTCSDGTKVGQCNTARTQICKPQGQLEATDCRTCGCGAPRESCQQDAASGVWGCKVQILSVDAEAL